MKYRIIGKFSDDTATGSFYLTIDKALPGRADVPDGTAWVADTELDLTSKRAIFSDANVWQWAKWAIQKTYAEQVEVVKIQDGKESSHETNETN